jgi:Domain of unknown function (DUF4158)
MRQHWEIDELIESWTLDPADLRFVRNKTRLDSAGFRCATEVLRAGSPFPASPDEIPIEAVDFVARQVGVRFDALSPYDWSRRSRKCHRAQIRARFGFQV